MTIRASMSVIALAGLFSVSAAAQETRWPLTVTGRSAQARVFSSPAGNEGNAIAQATTRCGRGASDIRVVDNRTGQSRSFDCATERLVGPAPAPVQAVSAQAMTDAAADGWSVHVQRSSGAWEIVNDRNDSEFRARALAGRQCVLRSAATDRRFPPNLAAKVVYSSGRARLFRCIDGRAVEVQ